MIMIYFENKLNILWQLHASGNFSEPHTASCWYHQIAFNMCSLQFDASFFCRTSVAQPFKFPPRMSSVPNLSKNIHRELISAARWQHASAETGPFQWLCAVLSFAVSMLWVGLRPLPARALLQDILQIKMKVYKKKTALADLHNHIDAQEHPFFKSTSDAVTDCDRLSWDTVTGHFICL